MSIDTNRFEIRNKQVRSVLWTILGLNLAVCIMKLIVGYSISSASMIADGYHSFSDGSSNIIGLIGLTIASKPADECHPYGHRKFEAITTICISLMLFIISINIVRSGIAKVYNPQVPAVDIYSFIVMLITIGINIFVVIYETKKGKELKSSILVSDAMHTKSDIYVSISVIFSLIAVKLGYPLLDPIISFLIASVIIKAGAEILINSINILCDASVIAPEEIIDLVSNIDGVINCHRVRTRGSINDFSMDLHILVDPAMTVQQSHDLHHTIEQKIIEKYSGVNYIGIHIEPYQGKTVES
ncbi:MAG TPA: cation transporter [Thermoanaerobacterales bacterium]|nr:cation transporter [Thermoanaerobacterales bacterium]